MKAKSILNRQHDSFKIPEGFYVEPYTPRVGRIISPSLNKELAYAKIKMAEDGTITYVDVAGNLNTDDTLSKGTHPFLVREIRACDVAVSIVHDGVLAPIEQTMTGPIYPNS